MTPQLITPLIQLPLVDPQLLGQLLGTAALHPLHRSALLFPTPTSISLSTLHSMLHGEFSSCLILRGHSTAMPRQGVLPKQFRENALRLHVFPTHPRDPSTAALTRFARSASAQDDKSSGAL